MNNDPLPLVDQEPYNADYLSETDELRSSSGGRLTWIAGSVVVLLVLGYVLSPKPAGPGQPAAAPSFMLEGAAVTATREKAVPAPAPAAPDAVETPTAAPAAAPATAQKTVAAVAAPIVADGPADPNVALAPAAPAPEPAAPVAQATPVAPATVSLTGRVLNEDGKPLVGATVLLKGSTKGTSTDGAGAYTLEVPAGDNTLLYGYGGYVDETVQARPGQPVNVTLTPRDDAKKHRR